MAADTGGRASFNSWWGQQSIPPGRTDFWQIGPLKLWLSHRPYQWQMTSSYLPDWLETRIRMSPGGTVDEAPPEKAARATYAFGPGDRSDLSFTPVLPDRALVTRLPDGFRVLPGEDVNLFVLTPLWLNISMSDPAKTVCEIPLFRPSDTWFGPVSNAGELAYASPGLAYMNLHDVPLRLHCAITAINIRNSGSDALRLERLSIPMTKLSLFYSPRTGFWTNSMVLDRAAGHEMAQARFDRQPPPEASPTQFITGPRAAGSDSAPVVRAFSSLFRERSQP